MCACERKTLRQIVSFSWSAIRVVRDGNVGDTVLLPTLGRAQLPSDIGRTHPPFRVSEHSSWGLSEQDKFLTSLGEQLQDGDYFPSCDNFLTPVQAAL